MLFSFWFLKIFLRQAQCVEENEDQDKVCVGIDLGTTYSAVATVSKSGASSLEILDLSGGKTNMPSVVKYIPYKDDETNKVSYIPRTGWDIYLDNLRNPSANTYLYAFKRYMGLSSLNESGLKGINNKVTYTVEEASAGKSGKTSIYMQIKDSNNNVVKRVSAIEASSRVLSHLLKIVYEKYGEENIASVVVTCPAYFSETQVEATKHAAQIAGISISRTLNEPVAAAYGFECLGQDEKHETPYLVFDFGGGTLDISICDYADGVLEVLCYSGDNFLGGENINDLLYKHFRNILEKQKVKLNETELLRLRIFTEDFKIALCSKQLEEPDTDVEYSDDFVYFSELSQKFTLKSSEFKKICSSIIQTIQEQIDGKNVGVISKYLSKSAGKSKDSIKKVLLVGGSTRVPFVRELLAENFGKEKISSALNADTSVAEGAALFAASELGWLKGDSPILADVVPMNIGICVQENTFEKIVDMESTIPATASKIFTTSRDNQREVRIRIAQGVRYNYSDNHHLGEIRLHLSENAPAGIPQINVEISIDQKRNVTVTATDMKTNKKEEIVIIPRDYELSAERVQEMLKDADMNSAADEKLKKKDEAVRELEEYLKTTNSLVQGTKLEEDAKNQVYKSIIAIEDFIKDAKNPMSGISAEDVKLRKKDFETEIQKFIGISTRPKDDEEEEKIPEGMGEQIPEGMGEEKADEFKPEEEKVREEL